MASVNSMYHWTKSQTTSCQVLLRLRGTLGYLRSSTPPCDACLWGSRLGGPRTAARAQLCGILRLACTAQDPAPQRFHALPRARLSALSGETSRAAHQACELSFNCQRQCSACRCVQQQPASLQTHGDGWIQRAAKERRSPGGDVARQFEPHAKQTAMPVWFAAVACLWAQTHSVWVAACPTPCLEPQVFKSAALHHLPNHVYGLRAFLVALLLLSKAANMATVARVRGLRVSVSSASLNMS